MEKNEIEALKLEYGHEFSDLEEEHAEFSMIEDEFVEVKRHMEMSRKVLRHDPTGIFIAITYVSKYGAAGDSAESYEPKWEYVFAHEVRVTKYMTAEAINADKKEP